VTSFSRAPLAMRLLVAIYVLVASVTTLALTSCKSQDLRAAGTPHGVAFALVHAFFLSSFAGRLNKYCAPTPALTLQMLCGILLRNIPGGVRKALGKGITRDAMDAAALARKFALGCVLARAGLACDVADAWVNRGSIGKLASVGMVEMCAASALFVVLFSVDVDVAFAGGFLLAGISLAVVIPPIAEFQRRGLGVDQGVPALIISAASFDAILAIVGFGICSGVVLADGGDDAVALAWKVPTQIVVGALVGPLLAKLFVICRFLSAPGKPRRGFTDASVVLLTVMVILFGATRLQTNGGGALMAVAFCGMLSFDWRRTGCETALRNASVVLTTVWSEFTGPLLFVIIGATLDLHSGSFWSIAPKALAVIFIGGLARAAGVFAATHGNSLMGLRERAFVAVAWTPKATIQAALAAVVYDHAVQAYGADSKQARDGNILLQTTLLAILLCAPLGAWCIAFFAPRLLKLQLVSPVSEKV